MADPTKVTHLKMLRAYPATIKSMLATLAFVEPIPTELVQLREKVLLAFLAARGEKNLNPNKVSHLVGVHSRANGIESYLLKNESRMVALFDLWLKIFPDVVPRIESSFTIMENNTVDPPDLPVIEDALSSYQGDELDRYRVAFTALTLTRRLGARKTAAVVVPIQPVSSERGAVSSQPASEAPSKQVRFESDILNEISARLQGLECTNPLWDEIPSFTDALNVISAEMLSDRSRGERSRRVGELYARWAEGYCEHTAHHEHSIPDFEVFLTVENLSELEAACDELFGHYNEYEKAVSDCGPTSRGFQKRLGEVIQAIEQSHQRVKNCFSIAALGSAPPVALPTVPSGGQLPNPPSPTPRPAIPPTTRIPRTSPSIPPIEASVVMPAQRPIDPSPTPAQSSQAPQKPVSEQQSSSVVSLEKGVSFLPIWHAPPDLPVEKDIRLCLDFGTARSKATAVRSNRDPILLDIGKSVGSRFEYSIASSVWIDSPSQTIQFGENAIEMSVKQGQHRQKRIDSLKDFLSGATTIGTELPDPWGVRLEPIYDPSGFGFSVGEILQLYLGYLTWTTEEALLRAGITSLLRRRFAIPSWAPKHRVAGSEMLGKYLARAIIVANAVEAHWTKGLPFKAARELLDAVFALPADKLPMTLLERGITEPIAAAGTRGDELLMSQRLMLVIDVGAGTTDFGLFLARTRDGHPRFIEIASKSVNLAGNRLDEALRKYVLDERFTHLSGPMRSAAEVSLHHEQRIYKEAIFSQGSATIALPGGLSTRVSREDFLALPEVIACENGLKGALLDLFNGVEASLIAEGGVSWSDYQNVMVVLTGGGARLPMVQALGKGPLSISRNPCFGPNRVTIERTLNRVIPSSLAKFGIREEVYLPLAVSWGGAMPELPEEGRAVNLKTEKCPGKELNWESAMVGEAEHWNKSKS